MPVVGECFGNAHPPHDHKRNMIHNSRRVSSATLIILPGQFPIRFRRPEERSRFLQAFAQIVGVFAKSSARHRVAALEHHEGGGQQDVLVPGDSREGLLGRLMPLIAFASQGEQTDRVHENQTHG
jgi:hypothetical protein